MPATSHLLQRAIGFIKEGRRAEAQAILQAIIRQDSHNETAWLWYAESCPLSSERIQVLEEMLAANPGSRQARAALARFRTGNQQARPAQQGPSSSTTRPVQHSPTSKDTSQAQSDRSASPAAGLSLLIIGLLFVLTVASSIYSIRLKTYSDSLTTDYLALLSSSTDLLVQNHNLQTEMESIVSGYLTLINEHGLLQEAHSGLQLEHNALQQNLVTLQTEHQALQHNYNQLSNDHLALQALYKALEVDYGRSVADFAEFRNIAIVPPYINVHNRVVDIAFYRGDHQTINHWNVPFELLEEAIEDGAQARQDQAILTFKTSSGELFYVMDYQPFIDPQPFETVITDIYYQSASDYDFIQEVWYIVAQLSDYSNELEETPRFPLETFLAGGGDCEDTSILLASMLMAAPVDWDIELVYMDAYYPLDPIEVNHVIVYVNTGADTRYYIETTSDTGGDMLPYSEGVKGWYLQLEPYK
jgi:hypothetical protein